MAEKKFNIPNVPGVSLVAFYGQKPQILTQLILELQQLLKANLQANFIPYELEQVHGTIIGCEGIQTETGIVNKWFYSLRNEIKYFDCRGFINHLQQTSILPLEITFGGYKTKLDYQFLSQQEHPYFRSFCIQKNKEKNFVPVLIGWALKEQVITSDLDLLRRDLQQFNCLHKYHKLPSDIDNDFYLRLGTIINYNNPESISNIQQAIINYLGQQPPKQIILDRNNIAIAKYQDLFLPTATTKFYNIIKIIQNPDLLFQLYEID